MKLIGLTGGVGMGKSTAAGLLRQRGLPVVGSDELARQLVAPGQPAWAEIRAQFGDEILGPEGRVLRHELARRVFADPAARRCLEGILHPRIRQAWQAQVEVWRAEGLTAAVNDIPLLFETQAESRFDVTVCVACSAATQRQRLAQRGWTAQEISQRLQAQWPIEQKMAKAQYVVWNEGAVEVLAQQLERVLSAECGAVVRASERGASKRGTCGRDP